MAQLLDTYERGLLDLPPGCEVTYEREAKNILRAQIGPTATVPALRTFYLDFRDREGRRPTAVEAMHEGYNPRSVRGAHSSWLEFVADQGDLDTMGIRARATAEAFLRSLETTPMTRSYKMLVLLSMLNRDAFPGSMSIDDLTEEFARVAGRSARTRRDVSAPLDDPPALRKLLEDNPIRAWVGGEGTGGTPFFAYADGRLRFLPAIPANLRATFQELVREIVDWRMAEYLRRDAAEVSEAAFDCKVSHAGANPILFLPDREVHANIPSGWTKVDMNGEPYQANFVKIALNVVQKEGIEKNELPEILYGWFGPDAGKPGTDFHVLFERAEDGWNATPKGVPGSRNGLEVGRSYRRQDVAPALGAKYGGQNWQAGVVMVGHRMLLFVTLVKTDMSQQYAYKDKFIARDVFQWQSQNQTTQEGTVGRRIRYHREQGIVIHLFVRKNAKENGQTMPFVYCGQLGFVEWEGKKPITVKWKLEHALTDSLAAHFGVPGESGGDADLAS